MYIRALERVASRYAPSRPLSFDVVHVFTALQMIRRYGKTSRKTLCAGLALGEGTVKTLVKHMKMNGLIETSNGGTKLTPKGRGICSGLTVTISEGMALPRCSVALGKFNYAVLVKEFDYAIRTGIEQRDAAIKMGAIGATTLIFRDHKFVMPASAHDSLKKDQDIRMMLLDKMKPGEGDVIIIGSAEESEKTAELAAKNAALFSVSSHDRHQ
jgi:hypothetical protein